MSGPEERLLNRQAHDVSKLLAEHGRQLYALLFRLTLRYEVAEDLLQDLFCRLTTSTGFQRADNRVAFAVRAATNLAFDWRRSQRRMPTGGDDCAELVSADRQPLADLVRREELDRTLSAVGELATTDREMIVLRYLERQDYDAIARQLGKTTHQVRALCCKAIKRLRARLPADVPAGKSIEKVGER